MWQEMFVIRFLVATIVCCAAIGSLAQVPTFHWGIQGGGVGDDRALSVAVDINSNVYVTGQFQATGVFGHTTLTNGGFFIAKYDERGGLVWIRQTGGDAPFGCGYSVAADEEGSTCVGSFQWTAHFGSNVLSAGRSDMFVARYDHAGEVLWAKQAGGSDVDVAYAVSLDSQGNCYITGYFQYTAIFDELSLTSAGQADVFVTKFDQLGRVLWVRKAGGIFNDSGNAIANDERGNIFVAGSFQGTANFGGIILTNSTVGYSDIFIAKYTTNGTVLWARGAGGPFDDSASGIAVDPSGNAYITGSFRSVANFNGINLTNSPSYTDLFLAKYDQTGNIIWATKTGGSADDFGFGIAVDRGGNSYLTGSFGSTANFGQTNVTAVGGDDIFVAKFSTAGDLLWAKQAGFIYADYGKAIALDKAGYAYVAGSFYDSTKFENNYVTGGGRVDVFVAKLGNAVPPDTLTIAVQPQSQTVSAGAQVTFNVTATSPSPVTYQWRFNDVAIPGATSDSLTLLNVSADQAGDYSVVVTDSDGYVVSPAAGLSLLGIAITPTLKIEGSIGNRYRISFKTNLSAVTWIPLSDIALPGSPYFYPDVTASNSPRRFYQLVPLP